MDNEKFKILEEKINNLIEQFSLLKKEKEEIDKKLKQKESENLNMLESLDKLHKEKEAIRSRLDSLINRLEEIST
jgi:FtsZ-binding cell division protein ZapB